MAQLIRKYQLEMVALQMLDLSESYMTADEAEVAEKARFFIDLARKHFGRFPDKPYLKGICISEILQNFKRIIQVGIVAVEQGADLIVIGSHGTAGLSKNLMGLQYREIGSVFRNGL